MQKSIIVSGGGIVGQTAAIALSQAGHKVQMLEKRSSWGAMGAGLALPANATFQLDRLGLLSQVREKALEARSISYFTAEGELLCQQGFKGLHYTDSPYLALPHSSLHKVIRENNPIPVAMGRYINNFEQNDERVEVALDSGEQLEADLLLVCEGIYSSTRTFWVNPSPPVDMGLFCWRFLAPSPQNLGDDPQLFLGGKNACLLYPLSADQIYFYAHRADHKLQWCNPEEAVKALREEFAGYNEDVQGVLAGLNSDTNVIARRMQVMDSQVWGKGRVLCIGDAAHGCGPILQQGVAQGLEDVAVLTEELATGSPLIQQVKNFVDRRFNRVAWVCENSNTRLKELNTQQEQVRNQALRENGPSHTTGWKKLYQNEP